MPNVETSIKTARDIRDCGRCGRKKDTFRDYDEYLYHVLNC